MLLVGLVFSADVHVLARTIQAFHFSIQCGAEVMKRRVLEELDVGMSTMMKIALQASHHLVKVIGEISISISLTHL